ncbi:MAG: DMT family transporter [bacterium]
MNIPVLRTKSKLYSGIGLLLLAVVFFDLMGAVIKYLGDVYPPQQLSFFRNIFGLVPSLLLLAFSESWVKQGRKIIIRQWKLGLFRGLLIAAAQFCYYLSLRHIEFAIATTISLSGPLFVTLLSAPVLKHKVGLIRWIAVFLGFIGILLVVNPDPRIFNWYSLLPLCSAFCYSSTSVTASLFDDSTPTPLMNMYTLVGALIGSFLSLFMTGTYTEIVQNQDWLWLFGMGVFGGTGVYLWVSAYRKTEPSNLSPFQYFSIPISFLMGWMFFGEAPFSKLFPGVLLILAGGFLVILHERRN